MKKYLKVTWTHNGENYRAEYKISEARYIGKLANDFPECTISVKLVEVSKRQYNSAFGLGDPFGNKDV